ncbi:MAG: permease-like cell division protein FtsX [bacterium]
MSLNLFYSFREGVVGLRRVRAATLITVSTMAVTLTLLGIFLVLTYNVRKAVELFKDRMDLEVFIDATLGEGEISELERRILNTEGVESVVFISENEALERFREESGLDPVELYGQNDLPASFKITLQREHRSSQGTETVAKALEALPGVDEAVYHARLYQVIDHYGRVVLMVDGAVFLIVLLSAILLVANTLRLTILSQRVVIQIMELVGATQGFIRRPYIIQGILQGGLGGIVGSCVVWGLRVIAELRFPHLFEIPFFLVFSPLLLGFILGFLGSQVGLRRFLGSMHCAFLP